MYTARIKGSDWAVSIGGFRDVKIGDVDSLLRSLEAEVSPNIFQLFDADRVGGWKHLYFAAVNAVRAFEARATVSKSLAMEVLLYASCQDQIAEAFKILGISSATERVALLVMAKCASDAEDAFSGASRVFGCEDDSVLRINDEKFEDLKRVYSVSNVELEAVGEMGEEALTLLLVEKGALLSVRR